MSLLCGAADIRFSPSIRGIDVPWPVLVAILPVWLSALPSVPIAGGPVKLVLFGRSLVDAIESLAEIWVFYVLGKGLRPLIPTVLQSSNRTSPVFATAAFRGGLACSSLAALALLAQVAALWFTPVPSPFAPSAPSSSRPATPSPTVPEAPIIQNPLTGPLVSPR